ncbi:hypothetical protein RJ639_020773 [Escallonia herrerae]|uniref:RNA cytidine acetyltransferase n=1 Tax=Escallonia herrerae TaxID=1293975 RepID=A0AA88V4B4_9ASTE|nr:hypothetical protein RJ639_020773 [Escallonia herrerae]
METNVLFSSKSVYNDIICNNVDSNHYDSKIWDKIWKVKTSRLVNFFMWIAAHNCLPTNALRASIGIDTTPNYEFYQQPVNPFAGVGEDLVGSDKLLEGSCGLGGETPNWVSLSGWRWRASRSRRSGSRRRCSRGQALAPRIGTASPATPCYTTFRIVNLHYMLSKSVVKSRPTVLWCYRDKLELSSHKKKRAKQVKKLMQRGLLDPEKDVHDRFRTESHTNATGRFNERFLLSLGSCKSCVVMDDELNILPLSSHMKLISSVAVKEDSEGLSEAERDLKNLKEQLNDDYPVGPLIKKCSTLDQGKAVITFLDAILDKTLRSTVALLAARGRGKSASLGLAIAGAVASGYSNIFVTAPSPENLKTLFEFVCKGFHMLEYKEHLDYDVVKSPNPEFKKATVRINIYKQHRQTIQSMAILKDKIHSLELKLGESENTSLIPISGMVVVGRVSGIKHSVTRVISTQVSNAQLSAADLADQLHAPI